MSTIEAAETTATPGTAESTQAATADAALKARHRSMWASGDYPALAAEVIADLGPTLVGACGVRSGQRVLDVAAGSGNAAIPAALAGAKVIAGDLTPELFEAGQRAAATRGAELAWAQSDAEAMQFADGEFDVVMSCVGVMFAPHHQVAADELVRVCRSGGTIGLLSWTPQGFIGQMFAAMRPFMPPPPAGAQPPPLWGDEGHVRGLLGDRVTDVRAERRTITVDRFASPAEYRDYFKARYGPTIAVYTGIADDADRVAELDAALIRLAESHDRGTGGGVVMEWEYLLLTATRA